MNNIPLLMKREFWEHRGGFLWAPVWITGVILIFTVLGILSAEAFHASSNVHVGISLNDLRDHIRDGKIALAATMDEVGERYAEVMVNPDKADAARALKPLNERQIFGKSIFLFDGIERARLAALGELHKPSVADLFVATMKGTYA